MPKSASRSLRSWLKSTDSENSSPNTLKNENSSGAEKEKKTSPTIHATPGKRVTRRNSQLDAAPTTPARTLRSTRRSSISENDNKVTASPLRRSARRLSQTLEDCCTTPTISRAKNVLTIDSPIKEENEKSEMMTSASRNDRNSDNIVKVNNSVKTIEENVMVKTPDSDLIIISDDDDDDVDPGQGTKKFNTDTDEVDKIYIKENAKDKQTALIVSQFVCKDENPNVDVHGNDDIVIENNIAATKDGATAVSTPVVCKESEKITEHVCDEVKIGHFESQENDNEEAITINVNKKQKDENDGKLIGGSINETQGSRSSFSEKQEETENKKQEYGNDRKLIEGSISEKQGSGSSLSEKQEETEEQQEVKEQENFIEISSDIELNTSIKDVNEKNNAKEVHLKVNPSEVESIAKNVKINDIIVETIYKTSPSSSVEQEIQVEENKTIAICDKKRHNESLDENSTTKETREIINSFDQSFSNGAENPNKSLRELKDKPESILNREELEINANDESLKKVQVSNNNSKIHKSVTFDSTKEPSSIKYPTTPSSKGKVYSDSFMRTLRNIDSSCETSANFNTSTLFKDSEDNDKSKQISFNLEMCPTTTDCVTPYKNINEEMGVSSSTPLSILKNAHKINEYAVTDMNKLDEGLIIKEGKLETNESELCSKVINLNEKNDLSLNSINELKNIECVLSQSSKELIIENVKGNISKEEAYDCNQKHDNNMVNHSLPIYFVSSGSESDDEYESESEKEKNVSDKGETNTKGKDTLQLNYRKSNSRNSTNLIQDKSTKEAQDKSTKEAVLENDKNENRNLKTNLETKNVNDSKEENLTYSKDISKNDDDYTSVVNERKAENLNLQQETCDNENMGSTNDNVQEKKALESNTYLKISNNNDRLQNPTEISKNTQKLQDNEIPEMTLNTSVTKTSIQRDSEDMDSEFQDPEEIITINNDSNLITKQNTETSKDPGCLNIFETKEVEFLNILKQDENSHILPEGSNQVETQKECKIIPAINEEHVLGNDLEIFSKADVSDLTELSEEENVPKFKKTVKNSKIIEELLLTENREIFESNLEHKDVSVANSQNSSSPVNSTKLINLNITKDKSTMHADPNKASPKIKNKNLVKNKDGQNPEEEKNIENNNNEKDVTDIINSNTNLYGETISNLTSSEQNETKLEMEKKPQSEIKNKSFECSRKRKQCTNENNLSLPFVAFAENNVDNIDLEESKVPEVNKSKIVKTSTSPVHSLNETFTSSHNLEDINECGYDEVNENNSNKELNNKSPTLQNNESEIKTLQKMKRQSSLGNEERIAPKFTKFNEGTSKFATFENMNKNDNLENSGKKTKKLSEYANDDYKRLLVSNDNSNKSITPYLKKTRGHTDNKVSQSTESENIVQTTNSAKKSSSKVKAEIKSKVIIDKENTSPTNTKRKLKKKLAAEVGEQNLLKVKKLEQEIIQLTASHKSIEKKLNKRNAKGIVQKTELQSTLHQKQVEKENGKVEMEIKSANNSKKLKERLLPNEILDAIDKPHKKSKKTNPCDLKETRKSRTESSNEVKLSQDLFRYSTSGGISDIIKNPSGIFFEEPITPDKKNKNKSYKNEKRKILSTIELPTGIVYEEPVTPDHKKIVNGFKETAVTPRAIGFKVKRILSAGQKEPPVYKKSTHKKRKLLFDEPSFVLPKPKWATSDFTVTKFPRAINLDESIATEFLVTPLQSKKSKAEVGLAPLTASAAYEFKKNALYNKQIPRQTSRQLLQRKEKQKYYMF